ncbi:MAG: type I-E CRISPR-associated endoribonuclease Cas2e [Gemmatimonadaceae bacterium]
MTVVVTRNAPDRYRGFLASCMLEIAPGVYTSPRMSDGVRERVWNVCVEWRDSLPQDGGVLLTWRDSQEPSGQGLRILGWSRTDIVDHNGIWVARRTVGDDLRDDADRGREQAH